MDFLLQSLLKEKSRVSFDLDYAYICSVLSGVAYLTYKDQMNFFLDNKFFDIKIVTNKNATVCLVCFKDDVFIIFQGTVFTDGEDIEDNLDLEWVEEGLGKVVKGYRNHLDLVWGDIVKYLANKKDKTIIFCGHSMGGAVGQIANQRIPNSLGYYFGSCRSVNRTLAKNNKSLIYQVRRKLDIVPYYPLAVFGYKYLGLPFLIKKDRVVLKRLKLINAIESVGYTSLYFICKVLKIIGIDNVLRNSVLSSHEIINYQAAILAVIKLANQQ
jgi:hypothetical protein